MLITGWHPGSVFLLEPIHLALGVQDGWDALLQPQFIAGDELLSFAFARLLLETINSSKNASAQKKTVCLFCLFFSSFQDFFSLAYPKLHLS